MAESSLAISASEAGTEWPHSVAPTEVVDLEDGSSKGGEQRSSSTEKHESIAVTVRKFLELRGVANQEGMNVIFHELCAEGSGTGSQEAPTVAQAAKTLFGVLNPIMNGMKAQTSRRILHNFQGTLKEGEMLLVIGKPGSGCTTFLKTLANMRDEYKDITGSITYGGMTANEMATKHPQDIIFCSEDDDHFPTLSVAQTLQFALRALVGPKATKKEIESTMRCLAKLVGLEGVLSTKVGNQYIRGVSGGERRRTSLAEAIATCARLVLLDNPTNGLDSSTAVEFIEMMRELTTQSRCATAMSIYQGSETILPYFDKVVVLNSGRQIYYGKVSEAKGYFQSLGFECSPTTTTTDFLNSMSADPEARRVIEGASPVPRTPEEFEETFKRSQQYRDVAKDVESSAREPSSALEAPHRPAYALPLHHQIWHCAFRQFRILISDYSTWGIEAACIIVQSLILGTLFRDQSRATQSFFILASSLFYAVLVPALQAMSEFGNTFAQRPLILKHKRYSLYRPSAYAFGLVFTDAVWKIMAIAYNIPLYFLTGFQTTASNFFIWFFVVYIEHLALSMFFRSVAVFSSNMNRAVLPVGIFFNMYVLYTGLYVPAPQMQVWLGWLRYLNPLYYGFESVMINEFASLTYACSDGDIVPSGPDYSDVAYQVCAVVGSTPGRATIPGIDYLRAQYGFEASHMWRNVGINAGLFVTFALCTGIGMELLKVPAGRLNTVFYKPGLGKLQSFSNGSDHEKGTIDPNVSLSVQRTRSSRKEVPQDSRENDQTFEWRDITLYIDTKEGARRLLDGLDGRIRKGQMKALMGMSGAGKTTLLNMLAGRNSIGKSSGELNLNGQALQKSFGRYMGYVQQQDIHLPTQTIREALQMTAQLRRPQHISMEEKNAYVETVIEWLEIEEIADTLIGVPGAGLNLEQRKRVTVGVEMAAKPEILFLDEPTSGLDGQSAASIIRLLRKLAHSGQAIICTIHQPAAELIGTFDELYLLARGGKLVYDGPVGENCSRAIGYFEKHSRPCGEQENPAEYFLEAIGAGSRGGTTLDWPQLWTEEKTRRSQQTREKSRNDSLSAHEGGAREAEAMYAAPLYVQLKIVLRRAWLFYWREPDYMTSKLWMNVGNSLLNSLTYLQSPTTQRGVYNRVFSAFMSLIVGPPLGLQVEPRFVALRDIFTHREKDSSTYSWFVFVVSAILIELPYAFVTSLVYWLLWYFPVGYLYDTSRAGYSFLMYELFAIFATSLAQLCATIMPDLSATFMANGFFFMYCNTFAGTLSPKPVTPSGWSWYYNVSPLFYLGEGVTVDVLQDLPIDCTPEEVSVFQTPNGTSCGDYASSFLQSATGYLLNPEGLGNCEYCRYKDGQAYYTQYGYDWSNRNKNVGIFVGFIAFNYTMIILITYLVRVKKWKAN